MIRRRGGELLRFHQISEEANHQVRDAWLPRVRKEPGCVDRRPFQKITNKTKERERRNSIVASGGRVCVLCHDGR